MPLVSRPFPQASPGPVNPRRTESGTRVQLCHLCVLQLHRNIKTERLGWQIDLHSRQTFPESLLFFFLGDLNDMQPTCNNGNMLKLLLKEKYSCHYICAGPTGLRETNGGVSQRHHRVIFTYLFFFFFGESLGPK